MCHSPGCMHPGKPISIHRGAAKEHTAVEARHDPNIAPTCVNMVSKSVGYNVDHEASPLHTQNNFAVPQSVMTHTVVLWSTTPCNLVELHTTLQPRNPKYCHVIK
jgi:hypothetical protein